jgi:hypothetical protein
MNALGFDRKNLEFDFERHWTSFRTSRACDFLKLFLEKEILLRQGQLESTRPEDLQGLQGELRFARRMEAVLGRTSAREALLETLDYLERK